MNFDTKDLRAIYPYITKNPLVAVAFAAFAVPIALLYCSTQYISEPIESKVFFGVLSIAVLIYSARIASLCTGGENVQSNEKA